MRIETNRKLTGRAAERLHRPFTKPCNARKHLSVKCTGEDRCSPLS